MQRSLTLVVHGESGAGKSTLADTAPGPRLILDVEGGIRFTPSTKRLWNPLEPPPELTEDESAVVLAHDSEQVKRTFQWLSQGQHAFRSVIIDSLTEAQKRVVDELTGTGAIQLQDYGTLLRKMEAMVRHFRDLTINPITPVDVVVFVCGTQEKGQSNPVMRPALLGRLSESLGYHVDVMAYLEMGTDEEGKLGTTAWFAPVRNVAAKDRTGRLGPMEVNPTIPGMLDVIYG